MMDNQLRGVESRIEEGGEGSSGEHGFQDNSATSLSGIRARNNRTANESDDSDDNDNDDDEEDDDDDSEQIMTPRGVYVHRCMCVAFPFSVCMAKFILSLHSLGLQ
jgi:hypothetical protein